MGRQVAGGAGLLSEEPVFAALTLMFLNVNFDMVDIRDILSLISCLHTHSNFNGVFRFSLMYRRIQCIDLSINVLL